MNSEWWYIIIMGLSGILFAAGGTQVSDKIDGQKWIRRIALPVSLGLTLWLCFGVDWWRCVAFSVASFGAFSLGYGDKSDWWKWEGSHYPKWFTACMIPLPTLFIGFSLWIFTYPLIFLGVFALQKYTKVSWKIFEFIAGAWFGVCLVGALTK